MIIFFHLQKEKKVMKNDLKINLHFSFEKSIKHKEAKIGSENGSKSRNENCLLLLNTLEIKLDTKISTEDKIHKDFNLCLFSSEKPSKKKCNIKESISKKMNNLILKNNLNKEMEDEKVSEFSESRESNTDITLLHNSNSALPLTIFKDNYGNFIVPKDEKERKELRKTFYTKNSHHTEYYRQFKENLEFNAEFYKAQIV